MSDSCSPRKLEAQFDGRYLMPSDLITSTMKSEPGTPWMRDCASAAGTSLSACAAFAEGGTAEGFRGDFSWATAAGVRAVAAPAAIAPVRNLRRPAFGPERFVARFIAMRVS